MTDKKTDADLLAILTPVRVKANYGSLWLHKKSNTYYIVVGTSLRESDLEPLVTYTAAFPVPGIQFTRTASEFLDGRYEKVWAQVIST